LRGKCPAGRPADAVVPEYADLAADPERQRWTLHHVLSMTMGTQWDESLPYYDPANSETAMDRAPDRYRYILSRPFVTEPGRRWVYNGGATALLGPPDRQGHRKSCRLCARNAVRSAWDRPDQLVRDRASELFAASASG